MTLLRIRVKLTLMKKLSLYIFLIFMFCNVGFAELISIADIKIGDRVTEYFTSKKISEYYQDDMERTAKGERVWGKDLKYSVIGFIAEGVAKEDYDVVQIYYENKTDKIVSVHGVDQSISKSDCINKRDKNVSIYKGKNRIKRFFKEQDTHKFPDGMVDDYIIFRNSKEIIGFACYIYQDGRIRYRFSQTETNYNDYIFEKFN